MKQSRGAINGQRAEHQQPESSAVGLYLEIVRQPPARRGESRQDRDISREAEHAGLGEQAQESVVMVQFAERLEFKLLTSIGEIRQLLIVKTAESDSRDGVVSDHSGRDVDKRGALLH